ncbi:hypothetical protein C2S53_008088 [Perilla frutescens var. hirtella]|uniref:F-box domain-containing protein n=1 Tax=Perilla frutescens var. hirtella TaxID=608512 RepID=A0AAD4IW26_PERFH|nr:hypothetical protein C2S53_008088 [Perilla frutescens var. hirtella]
MTEERDSSLTAAKLLITSPDGDPKAELPFSEHAVVRWDAVVDALSEANYCFAMRRLTPLSRHLTATGFPRNVSILSLHASKKAAFFYSNVDDLMESYYEISHEECLMDHLPSHLNLKGLPRFHRFTSLPEELQLSIVRLLDGASFATMRCVCRRFSLLRWDRDFDILRYSRCSGNGAEVEDLDYGVSLLELGFASAVCVAAVACAAVNDVGVHDGSDDMRNKYRHSEFVFMRDL